MNNYKVDFFKSDRENKKDEKGNVISTDITYKHLGFVTVDDSGVSPKLTLTAKAFRQATEICLLADKVLVTKLN